MSDRLKDLQRQRALAQEQAAALEREIAREMNAAAPLPKPPVPNPAVADGFHEHLAGLAASTPAKAADADQLIERYAEKGKPVHDQVKHGCLLYLGIAFALVGLGLLALYLHHRMK